MNELALFAGAGGGILGGVLLGWRTVCAVEFDPYARRVLLARQADGCLPRFPVWDDVRTFDGHPWRGHVDVISGGFPCQDISAAGKGAGIDGARSGLWSEFARIIGEVRPRHVFVENSPVLTSRGLGRVLGDLASLGFDARWGVLGACDAGAPHRRERIWIVATDAAGNGRSKGDPHEGGGRERNDTRPEFGSGDGGSDVADADGMRQLQPQGGERHERGRACDCGKNVANAEIREGRTDDPAVPGESVGICACEAGERRARGLGGGDRPGRPTIGWWRSEPDVGRVAHGVASRVDRLRCLGNGQVPAVARLAWETLT